MSTSSSDADADAENPVLSLCVLILRTAARCFARMAFLLALIVGALLFLAKSALSSVLQAGAVCFAVAASIVGKGARGFVSLLLLRHLPIGFVACF